MTTLKEKTRANIKKKKIQLDLFGSLKGKTKSFTSKERKEIWKI